MAENNQFEILLSVLKRFQEAGILKELPAKWAEKVLAVSSVHFPDLNQARAL